MSREYTYYVREFRTREDVQRFVSQEINDPSCPDEVVSIVLEHGRGWVLIGKSPRARVGAASGRVSEEMPSKGRKEPPTERDVWGRTGGGSSEPQAPRSYAPPGGRAYGPGAKSSSAPEPASSGGGERAIDSRGRRGTGRFKLP